MILLATSDDIKRRKHILDQGIQVIFSLDLTIIIEIFSDKKRALCIISIKSSFFRLAISRNEEIIVKAKSIFFDE